MKTHSVILAICLLLFIGASLAPCVQGHSNDAPISIVTTEETQYTSEESLVLPSSFSWRDINGVDFTTPIRNQNPYPSCETFALVAAVETMVQYKVGFPFNCDLSEAHLFFYSGGIIHWGSYPENDTDFLKTYGVPDEACWPYPHTLYQYPLNTTSPDWMNRTVKITNWSYLPDDPIAIKTALITNGPVPSYFLVYDDFLYFKKGIYRHKWGNVRGPHYMAIVGYNDDPGYWIVKNSWGTKFQEDGWVNIKYGECGIGKKSFYLTGVYGVLPLIYVDDDNLLGPWDGTSEHPYRTIQEGVDHAYTGYTVYVRNGTYHEHVLINKTIRLVGEDTSQTILDGDGVNDVVTITVPGVLLSGFTVQNSGPQTYDAGIKTLSLNSNVTIQETMVRNNTIGIYLNYAFETSWNIVRNNSISDNIKGIYAHWANNNQIIGNTITGNQDNGLEMERCKYATIQGNIISDNGGIGIYIRGASHRNVINGKNTIQDNMVGLMLSESNGNRVSKNNFIGNINHASFYNSFFTTWRKNYWDDRLFFFPKIIRGTFGPRQLPTFDVDWFPLRKPYSSQ